MTNAYQNEPLITQLLDLQPDSVVWFCPVVDSTSAATGVVTDFEAQYCNQAAARILGVTPDEVIGVRLLATSLMDEVSRRRIFDQCLHVWQTGEPVELTYYSPGLDRYFNVQRSKVQGGVLCITRDRTAEVKAESKRQEEKEKYQQLLNTSADGVLLLEAIRNDRGVITDFRIAYCNTAGFASGRLPADAIGKTIFEVLPHMKGHNQLDLHRHVVETGQAVRFETTFMAPDGTPYGWFIVSLTKLGDAVVSCFTDITRRKQHEQQIEEQQQLLHNILNASINGMFACEAIRDDEGKIVDLLMQKINPAFTQMLGLTESAVIGKTYLTLFPSSKQNGTFDLDCQVINTGISARKEMYYEGDHLDAWYDISASKLGKDGLLVSFADITARKKAIEEIEKQKTLLDNILRYSSSGISVTAVMRNKEGKVIDGKTVLANEAAIRYTGLPEDIYLNQTATQIDPHIIDSPYYQTCSNVLDTGEPALFQYYLAATGRWLELSISRMDKDHLITIFTDVTATKQAQLQTEEAAEKLRTIANTSQAGFFLGAPVLDEEGTIIDFRFTMVNQVLASFVGQEPQDLIGQLGSQWFVKYKSNGLFERFRDTYLSGVKQQFDFHYLGETVEVWANIMVNKLGDELLGTFTDFTPIKQLQLQLERLVDDLKRSNANLEEFAYIASHDLQEPLRKISVFADRLQHLLDGRLDEESLKMFERIEAATVRMRNLINDLLAYSKVSMRLDMAETVALNDLVQHVVQDLETPITESGATIHMGELPAVKGDKGQLFQLFQNLISNALKYRRPGVQPVITIYSKPVNQSEVKAQWPAVRKGTYHLIKVVDNGIGFDQESAEKIFQVFQRLHGRSEYEGTGVGLAIVQRVVTNHKGYISAQGQPGKGATFSLLLPA